MRERESEFVNVETFQMFCIHLESKQKKEKVDNVHINWNRRIELKEQHKKLDILKFLF